MDERKLVLPTTTWEGDRSSGFGNVSGVWNWGFVLVTSPPVRSHSHEQCLYQLLLQASHRLETFVLFLNPSFKPGIASRNVSVLVDIVLDKEIAYVKAKALGPKLRVKESSTRQGGR